MEKNIKIYLLILSLFILLFIVFFMNQGSDIKKVCINDNCFEVESAISNEEKRQGLMERESLDEQAGMLFIYEEEAVRSFWMKNMNFPIDLIWINKNKTIVGIEESLPPCKDNCQLYESPQAISVLEIKAGLASALKLRTGDTVVFIN